MEKPKADSVRAKADSVRRVRVSGKIPASEYWYADACQNVSACIRWGKTIWLLPRWHTCAP